MSKVFLNGRFVSLKDAKVSVLDRGFLYGDGAFETMRAYNGRVFMLREHAARLLGALKILKINPPYGKNAFISLVNNTVKRNKLKDAYIKLLVTRGVGYSGLDIPKAIKPTVLIYAAPIREIPESLYKKGISVNFAETIKNERSFTTGLKSLNYIDNVLSRDAARCLGFDETIFLNTKGYVTEAAASNIFIIKNGVIFTPSVKAGPLPGITRDAVIKIIKRYFGNRIIEKNLKRKDLFAADEAFLTNSILEIIPVVKLELKRIGAGSPGAFTGILRALYKFGVRKT